MANELIATTNYGTDQAVIDFAKEQKAKRLDEVINFVNEVYRLSAILKWDAFTICAQSAVETGNWGSSYWNDHLNPGGIGITYSGQASSTWANGVAAARAMLVHHSAYMLGRNTPEVLKPFISLDPRFEAVFEAGYGGKVKDWDDYGNGYWAVDPRYYTTIMQRRTAIKAYETTTSGQLVFGRVPHPPYRRDVISNTTAWNDLGVRKIVGTCVHRMEGTLIGTDGYFKGEARNKSLTDYGIGGAKDGSLDGLIIMWNDPRSRRAPWANGAANDLEGDGPAFVNKLGINAVNRDLVSIEVSGFYEAEQTPITDKQFESLCALVAYWHDQAQVPWYDFPLNPNVGVVTQMQHFEFAVKGCPGNPLKAWTTKYQNRVKEIMKQYQEVPLPTQEEPKPQEPAKRPQITQIEHREYYRSGPSATPRTLVIRQDADLYKSATTNSEKIGSVKAKQEVTSYYWCLGEEIEGEPIWWILDHLYGPRLHTSAVSFRPQ